MSLRDKEKYPTTQDVLKELTKFSGVGMKVASCVALYSMNRYDCVPTDVHILRLARNCYPSMRKIVKEKKSLTPTEVKTVMNEFVNIFGEYAGVAQMVLYGSQLSQFKERVPKEIRDAAFKTQTKKEEEESEEDDNSSEESQEEETYETRKRKVVRRK